MCSKLIFEEKKLIEKVEQCLVFFFVKFTNTKNYIKSTNSDDYQQ